MHTQPTTPTPAKFALIDAAKLKMIPCCHLIEAERPEDCAQPPDCELGRPAGPAYCPECPDYGPGINRAERVRCEVWTRVMGYHRPISAFNDGKAAEHRERRYFAEQPVAIVGDRPTVPVRPIGSVEQPSAARPRLQPRHQFAQGAGHD